MVVKAVSPRKPVRLSTQVAKGDVRLALEALRQTLAVALEGAAPREMAPLAKQLRDTMAALDALPQAKAVSTTDDLKRRRAARLAGSEVPAGAAGKVVGGAGRGGVGGERGAGVGPVAGRRVGGGARGA